jgi:transposase InsO family protein
LGHALPQRLLAPAILLAAQHSRAAPRSPRRRCPAGAAAEPRKGLSPRSGSALESRFGRLQGGHGVTARLGNPLHLLPQLRQVHGRGTGAEATDQAAHHSPPTAHRVRMRMGLAELFATREAIVSPCTAQPHSAWVEEQTEAFVAHVKERKLKAGLVFRDRDKIYVGFDQTLNKHGIDVLQLQYRSPNTNAFVERFIQTVQVECLDKFLVFGPEHFDLLVREFLEHYHTERPHQGKENVPLRSRPTAAEGEVQCRERLGGVLRHYYRRAA